MIVETVKSVSNQNLLTPSNSSSDLFYPRNITRTKKRLINKLLKNENLTSSESVLKLYDLMMPQLLLSNEQFNPINHQLNENSNYQFSPTIVDPEPLIVSDQQQPDDLQLIIDYYYQLYNENQQRNFPFTPASSLSFAPTVSYSLDEFSSFIPLDVDYHSISSHHSSSPTSPCTKKSYKPPPTRSSEPKCQNHTNVEMNNEKNIEKRDDRTYHEDDSDDTPLPYDPFEYLNRYRKAIHRNLNGNNNQQTNDINEDQDQEPEDFQKEEETTEQTIPSEASEQNEDEQIKSQRSDDNFAIGNEENDEEGESEIPANYIPKNEDDNENNENEQEIEPDKSNIKIEEEHPDLDTMTATKNDPDNIVWESRDEEEFDKFDQDYHESFSVPILFAKQIITVHNSTKISLGQDNKNKTQRIKRSLPMIAIETNLNSKVESNQDLHTSNSQPMIYNFFPPLRYQNYHHKPAAFTPMLHHWNQKDISTTINSGRKYRQFHRFPYPHYHVYYKHTRQFDNDNEHRISASKLFSKEKARPSILYREQGPFPILYSNLDEIYFDYKKKSPSESFIRRTHKFVDKDPIIHKYPHFSRSPLFTSDLQPPFDDYGSSLLHLGRRRYLPTTHLNINPEFMENNKDTSIIDNGIDDDLAAHKSSESDYDDLDENSVTESDYHQYQPFNVGSGQNYKSQRIMEYLDGMAMRKQKNFELNDNNYQYGYGF